MMCARRLARWPAFALLTFALAACPEDPKAPGIGQLIETGGPCSDNAECLSGICDAGICAPVDEAPRAQIDAPRVTIAGLPVTFSGANSSDPEGATLSYTWALQATPGGSVAALTDEGVEARMTPDRPGLFQVRLTVNDGVKSDAVDAVLFVVDEDGAYKLDDGEPCEGGVQCASGKCVDGACSSNNPPMADAGPSRTVAVGEEVTLDGSTSTDPDGDPLTSAWVLTQLPTGSAAILSSNDQTTTSFVADVEGFYVVRLFVNDGFLNSAPATIAILATSGDAELRPDGAACEKDDECESQFCYDNVCKTNEPPLAEAGLPKWVQIGTSVDLDASQSSDPENQALSYSWAINDAPEGSTASVGDAEAMTTAFTPDVPGVYVLRLVVNDGMLDSLPVTLGLFAQEDPVGLLDDGEPCSANTECKSNFCSTDTCATNLAPVADAGLDQSVDVGASVAMDGSGSSDADGASLIYLWAFESLPAGSAAVLDDPASVAPSFDADVPGSYALSLVVNDGDLDSLPDVVLVVAADPSLLPDGAPCTDDAECQSDFCFNDVCASNQPPTADAGLDQTVEAGSAVSLDGSASADPEGVTVTYAWSFDSQPAGSTATLSAVDAVAPTFTADVVGVYVLRLVVNDGLLDSQPDYVVITAADPSLFPDGDPCIDDAECQSDLCLLSVCTTNQAPTAAAGPDQTVTEGDVVALDGSGSSDVESPTVTYLWTMEGRPNGSLAVLSDPTVAAPTFTADAVGVYSLRLVVNDGLLDSQPDFVIVLANPVPGPAPDGEPCGVGADCQSNFCLVDTCATNLAPTAVIAPTTALDAGQLLNLDGTGSSDPEAQTLSYLWQVLEAPVGSTAALATPTAATTDFTPDVAGAYLVQLTVDDGQLSGVASALVVAQVVQKPNGDPCTTDAECTSGYCAPATSTCACQPESCAGLGAQCGAIDNGCGETLDCGGCGPGTSCNASNQCTCEPVTCGDLGVSCGDTWDDGCGGTLDCGTCPGPVSGAGSGVCNAGMCEFQCDVGSHLCTDACVADTSPAGCGTSCTPCPEPSSGTGAATCDGTSCGTSCNAGLEVCGTDCIDPLTDPSNCGGCGGAVCPFVCVDGACEIEYTLTILSGDNQTAWVSSPMPQLLQVEVTNPSGDPVSGVALTVTPSDGGGADPLGPTSNGAGIASVMLWSGRETGSYTFDITAAPASNTVTATLTATTPPDGTVLPVVNASQSGGGNVLPQGGPVVNISNSRGLAVASDGTVYFTSVDNDAIYVMTPKGTVTTLAGGNGNGNTGDGGPALSAQFNTLRDLALDETSNRLFVADQGVRRVRVIDLTTGLIDTYAGGGTSSPGKGDGGPANNAYLENPTRLSLSPDQKLYISEAAYATIRVVDLSNDVIDEFIEEAWEPGGFGLWGGCNEGCAMAWDASGRGYLNGQFSGGGFPNAPWSVLRYDPVAGSLEHVAGDQFGTKAAGVAAKSFRFTRMGDMALDAAGNIYVVDMDTEQIWRIDVTSTAVTPVAGAGGAGGGGDFGDAMSAFFNDPWNMAFGPTGNLIVADGQNNALRSLWGFGQATPGPLEIAVVQGAGQTVEVGAAIAPLGVQVTSGGTPVNGLPITWTSVTPGGSPSTEVIDTGVTGTALLTTARTGLATGTYTFEASVVDLMGDAATGSPISVDVTAAAPAAGTILTAVNVAKAAGSPTEGPALLSRVADPSGIAADSATGDVYFTASSRVLRLTPAGELTVLAGSGSTNCSGNGVDGLSVNLNWPQSLGLDEGNGLLYVLDRNCRRLYSLDLATNIMTVVAGTGGGGSSGDGGAGLLGTLNPSGPMAISPDGVWVYWPESAYAKIRYYNTSNNTLGNTFAGLGCGSPLAWSGCSGDSCHIAFDSAGDAYMAGGTVCGSTVTGSFYSIFKWTPGDTNLSLVAGVSGGPTDDGNPATGTTLPNTLRGIAIAPNDDILFVQGAQVRKIDAASQLISTVVGTGTAGGAGDYGPAADAQLSGAFGLALDGGDLYITETGTDCVRLVWQGP